MKPLMNLPLAGSWELFISYWEWYRSTMVKKERFALLQTLTLIMPISRKQLLNLFQESLCMEFDEFFTCLESPIDVFLFINRDNGG